MDGKLLKGYKALKNFYEGSDPPVDVVMDQLKLPAEKARELIAYMRNPPKRGRPKKSVPTVEKHIVSSIIRWIMLPIAPIAFACSCFFMIDTIGRTQPKLIAWLMSIVILAFGNMSLEVAVYQKQKKNKNWILFIATWLFIVVYSITATTSSFYTRTVARDSTKDAAVAVNNANRTILSTFDAQIATKESLIADKRVRLATFQKTLEKYIDVSIERGKEYNNAYWAASSMEGSIKKLEDEKEVIVQKKLTLLSENPDVMKDAELEKSKNYYAWVATLFHGRISASTVQFAVDLLPSILLDLISSLSLYVFLFMGKKRLDSEMKNQ
jgi:hypothetical protein